MRKKLSIGLLAAVLVLSLTACGKSGGTETTADGTADSAVEDAAESAAEDAEGTEAKQDLKPVRLGIPGSEGTFILLESGNVALKQGYFEEELNKVGYTLVEKYFPGCGPEINEAMAAGELDFSIYGDLPILVTKSNGIDTTVIASANSELQQAVFVMDDTLENPKDLEGKKVIVSQGTVTQHYWEEYVAANDIDISKVDVINTVSDVSSLLLAGEADAYVSNTYGLYVYTSQGMGKILGNSAEIPNGYSAQLVTVKTDFLEENPDVAVAINKALIRSYEAIKENPQVLYDSADTEQFSAELWEQVYSYDTSFDYLTPEITEEERTYLEYFDQWLVDNQMISSPVDLDNLIDTSYYEQAVTELAE